MKTPIDLLQEMSIDPFKEIEEKKLILKIVQYIEMYLENEIYKDENK